MSEKYGVVIGRSTGKPINEGYDLDEILTLVDDVNEQECELYDFTGDLAIGPKLLSDLVYRVKALEARLAEEELKNKTPF